MYYSDPDPDIAMSVTAALHGFFTLSLILDQNKTDAKQTKKK
jgi:hypothetical protein